MQDSTFAVLSFSDFPIFIFKVNQVFIQEKENSVGKVVLYEEELDGIEIDGMLNLENLPGTVLIISK